MSEVSAANDEQSVAEVWPSIGATAAGRWVGRCAGWSWGWSRVFTLGNLLAVVTLPVSLAVFFWQLMPGAARRYGLTSHRVVVYRGLRPVVAQAIGLEGFDAIDVEILPGQDWLRCGDLVFRSRGEEVFRLPGVPHPEAFRQTCWKARRALLAQGGTRSAQTSA